MLLAIDIGNSSLKFGLFEGEKLTAQFKLASGSEKSAGVLTEFFRANRVEKVSAIVASSVVPQWNEVLKKTAENIFEVNPIFVDYTFDFDFKIKYRTLSTLGVDRLIAAFGAAEKYGKPCIVCDFGTATTIDAINEKAEFLGGIIAPGMRILADALHEKTAALPLVEIEKPASVFGDSTETAIQSGIYFGYSGFVDRIVSKMIDEISEKPKIVATGGFAKMISESATSIQTIDENLMLDGLRLIYEKVSK